MQTKRSTGFLLNKLVHMELKVSINRAISSLLKCRQLTYLKTSIENKRRLAVRIVVAFKISLKFGNLR